MLETSSFLCWCMYMFFFAGVCTCFSMCRHVRKDKKVFSDEVPLLTVLHRARIRKDCRQVGASHFRAKLVTIHTVYMQCTSRVNVHRLSCP